MPLIIPQDLIEEILSALPVKSLLRFKSISKSCNALISSNPSFAKMQLERVAPWRTHILTATSTSGLNILDLQEESTLPRTRTTRTACRLGDRIRVLDFPPYTNKPGEMARILGSCHGLVALALAIDNDEGEQVKDDFYLWNPLTGVYNKFPQYPPLSIISNKLPSYRDTNRSLTLNQKIWMSGFGYDSSTDDYKVFVWIGMMSNFVPMIFSVTSNSWTSIPLPSALANFTGYSFRNNVGCFLNGNLHWASNFATIKGILSVDLKRERFDIVEWPDEERLIPPHKFPGLCNVGVVGGLLCLSFFRYGEIFPLPRLWVMKEYGVKDSWTKLLTFCDGIKRDLPLCITRLEREQHLITFSRVNELTRYEYEDEAKQIISAAETFQICRCDIRHDIVYRNNCSLGIYHPCQAVVCSETLYFPPLAKDRDNNNNNNNNIGDNSTKQESYPFPDSHFIFAPVLDQDQNFWPYLEPED